MVGAIRLLPSDLLDKLVRKVMTKQKEWAIDTGMLSRMADLGAVGRSMLLTISWKNGKATDYCFLLTKDRIIYSPDGFSKTATPTCTAIMDEDAFLDIYTRKDTVYGAYRHNRVIFAAGDDKWFYHANLIMELFNRMREITGF